MTYDLAELLRRASEELEKETARANAAEGKLQETREYATENAIQFGLPSHKIYSDYKAIRDAAIEWWARKEVKTKSRWARSAKVTMYLKEVHHIYPYIKEVGSRYDWALFDKATIVALEERLSS